jgi:hypothetical protein
MVNQKERKIAIKEEIKGLRKPSKKMNKQEQVIG